MANAEQLSILKQGVEVWNRWRDENQSTKIDLSGSTLRGKDLARVNFSDARLTRVDFQDANLQDARLTRADLSRASLIRTALNRGRLKDTRLSETIVLDANLQDVNLSGAYLHRVVLAATNLTGAYLYRTFFNDVFLNATRFTNAALAYTTLGSCDLGIATDLETTNHHGPSTIGMDTIYKSQGRIPESFLRGCGLSDADIEFARLPDRNLSNDQVNKVLERMYELRANQAVQISPLFISYSHADGSFVDKLEKQLNEKGIRFWRDIHDMKAGRIETQIDQAISQNRTVLLVLSKHSLNSDWVEHEVRTARGLEKDTSRDVLCPVALDDTWKSSPWPRRVMEQIMEYNILDFSAWEDDLKFEEIFRKLIDGLELFYKE